jgi:sulfonate transport system substrate-binding protein
VKKILIIAAVLLLFTVTGCSDSKPDSLSEDLKTVKIGFPGAANFMGGVAGIAQEKGYFEEELEKIGYKIEYIPFAAAGPAVNEALAGKRIDLAIYADFPGLVLKSKDIDITLLGVTDKYFNATTIVQADSPIQSVQELKGKKIAFTKGTYMQKYFMEVLELNGLTEKDVEIINVVTTDATAALLNGNVDALIYVDSFVIPLLVNQSAREIDSTRQHPDLRAQLVFVGIDSFIKENPDVPVAVIKALLKAKNFAKNDINEAFEIWTKSGLDEEGLTILYGTDSEQFESFFPIEIDQESIDKLTVTKSFLLDQELITNDFDIKEFVDRSYYEKAITE